MSRIERCDFVTVVEAGDKQAMSVSHFPDVDCRTGFAPVPAEYHDGICLRGWQAHGPGRTQRRTEVDEAYCYKETSALGGRNGGLLRHGSRILRIGQVPGFGNYGEAFSICEIDELNEHAYVERKLHARPYQIIAAEPNKFGAMNEREPTPPQT